MKRPRTLFGPFALAAALAIGFALGRMEAPVRRAPVTQAQLTKGAGNAAVARRPGPGIIVPVRGRTRRQLEDTWGDARTQGRRHEGIDILAPSGTAVLAAVDGRIVKFFDSERGGVTIYEFDRNQQFVYYYAHLSARAAGLAEGDLVRQGEVIGFVGMTGNAPTPHLHFEIQRLTPERRWWEADSLNPYPHLMAGRAPA